MHISSLLTQEKSRGNAWSLNSRALTAIWPDRMGFFLLIVLLSLVPFHQNVMGVFIYYKEIIAVLFFTLTFEYISRCRLKNIQPEIFLIIMFPALLFAWALLDPGNKLYDESMIVYSVNIQNIDSGLVILRNAFLYIPMVLYFSIRGLTRIDVRNIAIVCVAIAPISIFVFLYSLKDVSLINIGMAGAYYSPYLNYVPYLTVAAMSGMYLLSNHESLSLKALTALIVILIIIFAIFSTGRQNIAYLAICPLLFLVFSRELSLRTAALVVGIILGTVVFLGWYYLTSYEVSDKIIDRFTSLNGFFDLGEDVSDIIRSKIMWDGLMMLTPEQYLWGAGLTSSNGPGPHCDYIRWIQRVGLVVAINGFIPFFMCAKKVFQNLAFRRTDPIFIYIFLALGFTIFYSIFGFVREDPYESPFGFLGLAMALGLRRKNIT